MSGQPLEPDGTPPDDLGHKIVRGVGEALWRVLLAAALLGGFALALYLWWAINPQIDCYTIIQAEEPPLGCRQVGEDPVSIISFYGSPRGVAGFVGALLFGALFTVVTGAWSILTEGD